MVKDGIKVISLEIIYSAEAKPLEDSYELGVVEHIKVHHSLLDKWVVKSMSHRTYLFVLIATNVIIDVLPDSVREVVQSHFNFDDRVWFLVRITESQKLDEADIERVSSLLGDGV